jgi:hypothetical protein
MVDHRAEPNPAKEARVAEDEKKVSTSTEDEKKADALAKVWTMFGPTPADPRAEARAACNIIAKFFKMDPPRLPPEGAMKTFIEVMDKANSPESPQWDELLGRPVEKGTNLRVERAKLELEKQILDIVRERHAAGESIEKGMLAAICRKFALSPARARKRRLEAIGQKFVLNRIAVEEAYRTAIGKFMNELAEPDIFAFAMDKNT